VGCQSPDDKKIVAMAAQLNALKGHLKVDKHLEDALNNDKKTRNKKNKGNTNRQREDKVWKKIPLKYGNKKSKQVGKHTLDWYEHHMAWCMHLPSKCCLGKQCEEEQRPTVGATSATYAATVASIANPQFQALIASIAGLQGQFDEE
jgi:hypothetical protein